mgnify:CR=1 FL=1
MLNQSEIDSQILDHSEMTSKGNSGIRRILSSGEGVIIETV